MPRSSHSSRPSSPSSSSRSGRSIRPSSPSSPSSSSRPIRHHPYQPQQEQDSRSIVIPPEADTNLLDEIRSLKAEYDREAEEAKDDGDDAIYDNLSIEFNEDDLDSPPSNEEYSQESCPSQQSLQSLQSLPVSNDANLNTADDKKLDIDCVPIINDVYLECEKNLKNFFNENEGIINRDLNGKIIGEGNEHLQINTNSATDGKFILEINRQHSGNIIECLHISLFTKDNNMRGVHFTFPSKIIRAENKKYSHLYIGHTVVEDALYTAKAAKKFIRIVLKSMGTYFKTKMSIGKPGISAKPRITNFINDLQLEDTQRKAIGELLIDIAKQYKDFYTSSEAAIRGAASRSARRGGMKIMKYNKIVEKNNAKIHNKDGKNTLVNNKELKINKIKDKIKILKLDKIKNKDKIIKQIKLIEDIKTKIKIEKEIAKLKKIEKTSIIRKASVLKTPKTPTTKPKTPKATTTKPKTPKATTTKPKTPKATTTKPKTPTTKPKTPKTPTTKPKTPKTTTTKPKKQTTK